MSWYSFVARNCLSVKERLWVRRLKVLQVKAKKQRVFFLFCFLKKKKKLSRPEKQAHNQRLTNSELQKKST